MSSFSLCQALHQLYKNFKRLLSPTTWEAFRRQRNQVWKLLKFAKSKYVELTNASDQDRGGKFELGSQTTAGTKTINSSNNQYQSLFLTKLQTVPF